MFLKSKKLLAGILLGVCGLYAMPSHAGLVWFSRANCANNESIAWDWPTNSYWLWTYGYHFRNDYFNYGWEPQLQTGWENTYRSAAVHWGEGVTGGAFVMGDFYLWNGYGTVYLGNSSTEGCNLGYFFPYW